MKATLHFPLVVVMVALLSCALAGISHGAEPSVTHLASVVSVDLVGTAEYRIHGTTYMLRRDQLRPYIGELFKRVPRHPDRHYSITLYSFDVPPPASVVDTPQHIAPVLDIAREFECDVYIIHPDEAGLNVEDIYYRIAPPQKHDHG